MKKVKIKKENQVTRVVNVRLTISDFKAVEKYLKDNGKKKISPFIREQILAKIYS